MVTHNMNLCSVTVRVSPMDVKRTGYSVGSGASFDPITCIPWGVKPKWPDYSEQIYLDLFQNPCTFAILLRPASLPRHVWLEKKQHLAHFTTLRTQNLGPTVGILLGPLWFQLKLFKRPGWKLIYSTKKNCCERCLFSNVSQWEKVSLGPNGITD